MQPAASDRKTAWRLIRGPWPLVWGAVALVVLKFATLALSGRPWSITSAFAIWGAKALDHFGFDVAFWQYWADAQDSFLATLNHYIAPVIDIGTLHGALAVPSLSCSFYPT